MNIDALIKALQDLKEVHGNIDVYGYTTSDQQGFLIELYVCISIYE
jgi:hypothetical protein